jgi:regulation of enolase protein 1 (concanavalin A-like superfamily)
VKKLSNILSVCPGGCAGSYQLGAVGTNGGNSDWSMSEFPAECNELDLRIRREATTYTVEAKRAGRPWMCIRRLVLMDDKAGGPVMAGLYAAAPMGDGASAEFKFLRIEPGRLSRCQTVDSIPEEPIPR